MVCPHRRFPVEREVDKDMTVAKLCRDADIGPVLQINDLDTANFGAVNARIKPGAGAAIEAVAGQLAGQGIVHDLCVVRAQARYAGHIGLGKRCKHDHAPSGWLTWPCVMQGRSVLISEEKTHVLR